MDLVFHDFALHILVIHAPDAVLVLDQGAVDDAVAVVGQRAREADVGGAVEQHLVAPGAEDVQGRDHAAQNAVLVADVLGFQTGHAVAGFVPADDGAEILLGGHEVAVGRVHGALDHGLGNGGDHGEIHVGHPHGDGIKAGQGRAGGKAVGLADHIHDNGILAMSVHDGGKIVFHNLLLSGLARFLFHGIIIVRKDDPVKSTNDNHERACRFGRPSPS